MSIKKKYCILIVVLAFSVLLSLGGVVYYHGEWWYPAWYAMRPLSEPALTEIAPDGDIRLWTLEELFAAENVTRSNNLLLVNSAHPLPEDYIPELIEYNGAKMHPLMKDPYISMRDDIQEQTGVRVYVASDYRTAEEQQEIINSSEEGIAAEVGCSEHEAGLALDIYAPYYAGINFLR